MKFATEILVLMALSVGLLGCGQSGLEVETSFASTQDITEGAPVYLGDQVIGSVSSVSKTQFGSKVLMSLDEELAKGVYANAAVLVNRKRQGAPLEIHNPPSIRPEALKQGQTLKGLDSTLQLVGWGVGSALEAGAEGLSAAQGYLKSDEFDRDKAKAGIALDKAVKITKDGIHELEQDLSAAITDLSVSEDELAALVEELGEELAPMVKELAESGTGLALELEKITQGLEDSAGGDGVTGEKFLHSLNQMLEALDRSFDEGVEEGANP